MAAEDLCTAEEFTSARPSFDDGGDPTEIARCITVASQWLATECGGQLYESASPETRTFVAPASATALVDNIATLTDLVVVDYGTTLTIDSDFVALPAGGRWSGGITGPWYMLRRLDGLTWNYAGGRLSIAVTATWGWPGGPSELAKQACIEVTADVLRTRSNNYGVIGIDAGLAVKLRTNAHVAELIAGHARGDRRRGWAMA